MFDGDAGQGCSVVVERALGELAFVGRRWSGVPVVMVDLPATAWGEAPSRARIRSYVAGGA